MAAAPFLSSDWPDAYWAELRGDDELRSCGSTWVYGPIGLLVEGDDAAGTDEDRLLRVDLHEGEVRDVRTVPTDRLRQVPTVIAAPYTRWKATVQGGGNLVDALRAGSYTMRGDLPTLARHDELLAALVAAAGRVTGSWPDDEASDAQGGAAR